MHFIEIHEEVILCIVLSAFKAEFFPQFSGFGPIKSLTESHLAILVWKATHWLEDVYTYVI